MGRKSSVKAIDKRGTVTRWYAEEMSDGDIVMWTKGGMWGSYRAGRFAPKLGRDWWRELFKDSGVKLEF